MASDPSVEAVKALQSSRRSEWLFALALLALTIAAYYPAWFGKPVWDDAHLTRAELRSWTGLYRIWAQPGATQQYYPLVHSAFWVQQKLWGDWTGGYHLVNILLHVTCALLLLKILRLLEAPGAWLAAAIFALHPMEVESVAWISELKNTLSGAFYLGAALVYLRYDRSRERRLYLTGLGLFFLGLFCKTVIATLPAALLVVFWWKRGTLSWKRDARPLVPFFALGIGMGLFTAHVEKGFIVTGGESGAFNFTLVERFLIAGRAFWFYIGKLLWPAHLVFIYPRWDVSAGVWWQYLFPAAALALLAALWMLRKRTRAPLAAALFFGGTLFPALGFINVYPFIYSFVADHFQYLAGIGIIVPAAAGAALLSKRLKGWQRTAGHLAAAAILMLLAALTWRQSAMYCDIDTLYMTTIEKNPACWMAWDNLGADLLQKGRVDEAISHMQKALEIKPAFVEAHYNLANAYVKKGRIDDAIVQYRKALDLKPYFAYAHDNLGIALFQQGRIEEAITQYRMALDIDPGNAEAHYNLANALLQKGEVEESLVHYQKALEINPDFAEAHYGLGNVLFKNGRVEEAISHFQKALEIKPGYAEAENNLGAAFYNAGQVDEAIAHYQKALEIKPGDADAHYNMGNALKQKNQFAAAIAHYQKALEIKPGYLEVLNNLAYTLATCPQDSLRDGAKAVALAEQANQATKGGNPITLGTLAAAYAETGEFSKAVGTAQRAVELANSQSNTALASTLQSQIVLYKAHTPLRDESSGK